VTEMTPILNSVQSSSENLQRRRVVFIVVTSIQSDFREHDDITELTPIWNSVHTSNYSLQRRRVALIVFTST
jgi:hypothetical protein